MSIPRNNSKQLFSPNSIAGELQTFFGRFAAEKSLLFDCNVEEATSKLMLEGSECRLTMLLSNLVSNAIRFTNKGMVTISFSHREINNNTVELLVHVKDTGSGIAESEEKEVFTSHATGGLGLAVSKQLAEMLGGTITLDNAEGYGCDFEVRIPYHFEFSSFAAEEKNANVLVAEHSEHEREKKVLVVDDDEMSMLLMSNILRKHSIPHAQASGGKEAINQLKNSQFDMVLTDINMPGLSGKELLQQLKAISQPDRMIPVVAVTSAKKNEVEDYESFGFTKVLYKPFKEEELIKTIQQNLNISENSQTAAKYPDTVSSQKNPSFSLDELKRISNNSGDFIKMMLQKFADISTLNTDKMMAAMLNGDREIIMQLAHKSIPSYHMLGLTGMAEQLQCIERNMRDGKDISESSMLIRMVHDHTRKVVAEILNYLRNFKENELIK